MPDTEHIDEMHKAAETLVATIRKAYPRAGRRATFLVGEAVVTMAIEEALPAITVEPGSQ